MESTHRAPTARRRTGLAALAALATVAGGLVLAQANPAGAAIPGHRFETNLSNANLSSSDSSTATCDPGEDLVGSTGQVVNGGADVVLTAIVPDLTTNSVEVRAAEKPGSTTNNWQLRAEAICVDAGAFPELYLAEDVGSDSPGNPAASATAECDEFDTVLAAGFETTAPAGQVNLTTLLPTDDVVLAVAQEKVSGVGSRWDITSTAICAGFVEPYVAVDESIANGSAVCLTDHFVTGSGGHVFDPSGDTGHFAITSVNPGVFGGTHLSTMGIAEVSQTASNPSRYAYAVCARLS